jgi:hypothetical protein
MCFMEKIHDLVAQTCINKVSIIHFLDLTMPSILDVEYYIMCHFLQCFLFQVFKYYD